MKLFLFIPATVIGAAISLATAYAEESVAPLSTFKDCSACPEMVVVPAGEFMMGSPNDEPMRSSREGPRRKVVLSRPFAIGKFEVTFEEWDACVSDGGCEGHVPVDRGWGRGRHPVILVSWQHAQSYVAWLNATTGHTYRLPSEAEWEYAARAGTETPFSTGPKITASQANFDATQTYNGSAEGEFRQQTMVVGSFPPNAFGLHDMHGNLYEFVQDCWHNDYDSAPGDGTAWLVDGCKRRVRRGGSWKSRPAFLRSAARAKVFMQYAKDVFGFRVARDLN